MPRKYVKKHFSKPRNKLTYRRRIIGAEQADWEGDANRVYQTAELIYTNTRLGSSGAADNGTSRCISHIKVDLQNLPYAKLVNQQTGITTEYTPGGGWAIVYVPEGTSPNKIFNQKPMETDPDLYEPQQYVLGYGTWLNGPLNESTSQIGLTNGTFSPAGNNVRIRCKLSKRCNPGDSIFLIYWLIEVPQIFDTISNLRGIVSYALRVLLVCCYTQNRIPIGIRKDVIEI